jgi:hypothetical protein
MDRKEFRHLLFIIALLAIVALACNMPGFTAKQTVIETEPPEEVRLDAPATADEAQSSPPSETPQPSPTITETPTVEHQMWPSEPGPVQAFVTDKSSAGTASQKTTSGDSFELNLFERPFTSEVMEYLPYLDLRRGDLNFIDPWVYVTITLEGDPPADSAATYGIELDLDIDGRGDWYIFGIVPPGTSWTTDGVRACRDQNVDVGGPRPILSDPPSPTRDGYENCVFENGYGVGPDEAWIRRAPAAKQIQLAFKYSLILSDPEFLYAVIADDIVKDPSKWDNNDSMTLQEAGSPVSTYNYYPLKALHSYDNTCRWAYGFDPDGSEPGVCYVPPTPTPTFTPTSTPTKTSTPILIR